MPTDPVSGPRDAAGRLALGMPIPRDQPPADESSRPRRRWRRWLALGLAGAVVAWLLVVLPPPLWLRFRDPDSTAFMDLRRRQAVAAGEPYEVRHDPVPLAAMAPVLRRAVVLAEDHRFFEHGGLDWIEVRRALGYPRDAFSVASRRHWAVLWYGLGEALLEGRSVRGASTITQQLAKNLYLSPSRSLVRKAKEALLAKRLEWALSKDRILELYLNHVEFGRGIWGVEAASRAYFGKSARQLSRGEAAALAATLPAPLRSNPGFRPAEMRARQARILARLR